MKTLYYWHAINTLAVSGGATRSLTRDGNTEEFRGDPISTVGPLLGLRGIPPHPHSSEGVG